MATAEVCKVIQAVVKQEQFQLPITLDQIVGSKQQLIMFTNLIMESLAEMLRR